MSPNSPNCSMPPGSTRTRPLSAATAPPATSTTSRSATAAPTDAAAAVTPTLPEDPLCDDPAAHGLRESATFDRATIHAIQRAAETGIYDIRGGGAKRRLPH